MVTTRCQNKNLKYNLCNGRRKKVNSSTSLTDPRSSVNSKQEKYIQKLIIVKLLKTKDKKQILKCNQNKEIYREMGTEMKNDYHPKQKEAGRQCNNIFKILKNQRREGKNHRIISTCSKVRSDKI